MKKGGVEIKRSERARLQTSGTLFKVSVSTPFIENQKSGGGIKREIQGFTAKKWGQDAKSARKFLEIEKPKTESPAQQRRRLAEEKRQQAEQDRLDCDRCRIETNHRTTNPDEAREILRKFHAGEIGRKPEPEPEPYDEDPVPF